MSYLIEVLWRHMVTVILDSIGSGNQCWLDHQSIAIHLRAIWQDISQSLITKFSLKIMYLNFLSNLPGANELNGNLIHEDAMGIKV